MNSRISTILSKPLPASGRPLPFSGSAAAVLAFLITGCGSSAPAPKEQDATLVQLQQPGENGEGTISFHYSNKSTDANLSIDLGNTDLYMEMSGEPPKLANGEAAVTEEKRPPPIPKAPKPQAQEREQEEPDPGEPEPPRTAMRKKAEARPEAKKEPEPKQELQLPEEDQDNSPDVTSRVLAGIRKAQELFYQKRYPEAMQAVKSSIDARPTAEGYALAGSIHYMMGQGGMARRQWMEALRLNPDMPSVVNMLEKTRTPGGRGSPSPRPILPRPVQRTAPAPLPEAEHPPFPEVYNEPAYNYPSAPAAPPAAPPAPQAPGSEAVESAVEAEPSAVAPAASAVPAAPVPVPAPAAAPAAPAKTAPAKAAPAKAAPAKAAPAKAAPAAAAEPHAPEAHAAPAKPADTSARTKLPSAKPAKEGKAK
jgi:hypothetical protein